MMKFRFRFLRPDGGEVQVESLDALRTLIRNGVVEDLTLLQDALTREWAPARAHAVYRLMRELGPVPDEPPAAKPTAAAPVASPPPAASAPSVAAATNGKSHRRKAPRDGGLPDLGVTLSFEAPLVDSDPDRVIRSLLREREQERRPTERVGSFAAPSATSRVEDDLPLIPPPPLERASPPGGMPPRVIQASRLVFSDPHPSRVLRLDWLQGWLEDARAEARRQLSRLTPPTLITVGLGGLLIILLAVPRGRAEESAAGSGAMATASLAAPDLSELVARSATAKASGFKNMVAGMDSLRRAHDVAEVPKVWLEGAYLADARRYPEVEGFWLRYQEFLRDMEASETALFRSGFVKEASLEGVDPGVLSLRMSRAMRDFKESEPERTAVYAEMEELARASLALHALLVERADDIDWSPAIQQGVSRDPVVEAVAQDTVLHDRMWSLLERIFASLETLGGNLGGSRDNLTDLLLQGIEATGR